MTLREYQRKRDFARTPEPKGKVARDRVSAPRYVVQRHHASRLHWDVRLEMDGVLASWAVPKGPPLEGGKKRLAVHTEDHPMQYLTFEGEIPDGYGAGTMRIWDTGTYELQSRKPKELKLTFHGTKLDGSYVLVQTAQNEGRDWLLIKHDSAVRDHPLDARIRPMLATLANDAFDAADWGFEAKLDGVRTIAFVDGGEVRLQTRNLRDCTAQYPEVELGIAQALTGGYQAILDGEIVALDDQGRPSFQLLQPRMHQTNPGKIASLRRQVPVFYYVFDLLWIDGQDLARLPLRERKERLEGVITPMGAVRLSSLIEREGRQLLEAAVDRGLEGIVAKRLDAPYLEGRSSLWLKVKAKRSTDCVIAGWTEGEGSRSGTLGALLLGQYDGDELKYVGHVGTGFDDYTLRDQLLPQLRGRETRNAPFQVKPKTNSPPHWCAPELVCRVEFAEWTDEGILRQPSYKGLRADLDPRDCRLAEREADVRSATKRAETETKRALEDESASPVSKPAPVLVPAVLEIDGRNLRLTNLDKVLFPEDGYTKADLIRLYVDLSPQLLPYLSGRPLTLKPYPDGIHGTRFYQKDKPDFTPSWIRTWRGWSSIKEAEIEYIVCEDLATLVWLANYTCIEMHPWLSRVDDPEHPDFAMIDIDPQPGATFESVKSVAQVVRTFLEERGLVGFPKTTGSRGIHVLVPIARVHTYDQVRDFVQEIAAYAHQRLPNTITREWQKSKRGARVLIDYLQNRLGATTAGPYSVRPLPSAPISTPFDWDELGDLRSSDQFNAANIRRRLADVGDLLEPAYGMAQELTVPQPATRAGEDSRSTVDRARTASVSRGRGRRR
jgi:bifunctional non-homologous end joining protein LigD